MENDIGLRIRTMRMLRGLHQADLAVQVGISRQALIALEAGQALPSAGTLVRLTAALGVDINSEAVDRAVSLLRGDTVEAQLFSHLRGEAVTLDEVAAATGIDINVIYDLMLGKVLLSDEQRELFLREYPETRAFLCADEVAG